MTVGFGRSVFLFDRNTKEEGCAKKGKKVTTTVEETSTEKVTS